MNKCAGRKKVRLIVGIDFKTVDGVPVPVVDDNLIRCVVTP